MVRPKLVEGGKRRLMVTEEAYRILQQIAVIAELSGAGAAADRLALRYGELMRSEYETLNTPFNPQSQTTPPEKKVLDNSQPIVRQPTAQNNPLVAALGIF